MKEGVDVKPQACWGKAASRFFEQAFDAKPLFDNIKRSDEPFEGAKAQGLVGMAPDAVLVTMRMMQLGNGPDNRWRYGRTPWDSAIELMSSPGSQAYERDTPLGDLPR